MDLILSLKQQLATQSFHRVVVAYSGGLDSSALLHAVSLCKFPQPVLAIHVNHGLSKHADSWVEHCEQTCHQLNIPLSVFHVQLDAEQGNLEMQARQARYEVFESQLEQGDLLLMAHHEDDQVETFMMRLMRGSGLTGLSAMPIKRELGKGQLLRPWLQASQQTLQKFVKEQNIQHIDDESNDDIQFDRNWWRHELLPKLQGRYPQSSRSIVRSIEALQQESKLLNELLEPVYEEVVNKQDQLICRELLKHSGDLQVQLLRTWLAKLSIFPSLSKPQLQQVIQDVILAQTDAEPVYKWHQSEIRRYDGRLYLLRGELSSWNASYDGTFQGEDISLPQGLLHLVTGKIDGQQEGLIPQAYELTCYQGGLSAKPLGRSTKTLKKWFQTYGIPPWQRAAWPVLLKDGQVAAVPGLFLCEGFQGPLGWQLEYSLNKK
jgi:tRNA(Ile)-lysidine synthase